MKRDMPPQLKLLVAQVKANPRLQLGLAFIVMLLLGWVFLVLGDQRDAALKRLDVARQHLAQVQQLAGQSVWIARAQEAGRLANVLDAEIPPAQSAGLAQADFQGWLKEIVDSQGANLRLDVQPPTRVDAPADIVQVTAVVSGPMEPARVWQMINRIESRPALVTMPTALVRSNGTDHSFSLTIQGYYRLPASATGVAP